MRSSSETLLTKRVAQMGPDHPSPTLGKNSRVRRSGPLMPGSHARACPPLPVPPQPWGHRHALLRRRLAPGAENMGAEPETNTTGLRGAPSRVSPFTTGRWKTQGELAAEHRRIVIALCSALFVESLVIEVSVLRDSRHINTWFMCPLSSCFHNKPL